jgi:hypothetical protein
MRLCLRKRGALKSGPKSREVRCSHWIPRGGRSLYHRWHSSYARTLDPATSEKLASRAKECSVPLAQVAIWKTPGASGGAIRIRSGSYISPVFTLNDTPQRVAIPFPAPYASGQGLISVEGAADGAVISISPAWTSIHQSNRPASM